MPDGLSERSKPPVASPVEPPRSSGLVIATLVGLDDGDPVLCYPGMPDRPGGVRGASTVPLRVEDLGAAVVVAFVSGDPALPLVLGRMPEADAEHELDGRGPVVVADGRRVRVEAEQELVLCCGKASITLRANGRIVVRGTYVETRARGVNRIRGGSVAIN